MKTINTLMSLTLLLAGSLFASGQTSGKIFFDHTSDLSENGINAFNLKRAYLSYGNSVNENLSYKMTYDIGKNESGSAHTVFLKVAMLKWKTNLGNITMGMQGVNMFKTMEDTWGHRFIQTMPMDTYKFSASADIGLGLTKSFGSLSTSALITNGGGYKKIESDSHKKISLHAVYGESQLNKKEGFNLGASFSYEPYDQDIIGDFDNDPNTTMPEDSTMISIENTGVLGLFGGYSGNKIRIGFEFDKKGTLGKNSQIISAYGTAVLSEKVSVLGRFDQYDENTDFSGGGEQYIVVGVLYKAEKGLNIAPTFRMKTPEGGDAENSIVVNFQFKF